MPLPRTLAAAAALALAVTATAAATSTAAPSPKPTPATLADGLVVPLSLAVDDGKAYVTQNFAGLLTKLRPGKSPKTLYASQGGNEVGGVSVRDGRVVFTETASDPETGEPADSWVKVLGKDGTASTLAHVRTWEEAHNPDAKITYGIRDLSEECAASWPQDGPPASYSGAIDSHPYATYQAARRVFVADAGMNAVLAISRGGGIRSLAVTPPVQVEVTEQMAQQIGAPECAVGHTYYGESVPTDVEMGPDGKLYVTTEGGGFGEQQPLGAVYRLDPSTGKIKKIAGGLMTPTGVAVSRTGKLFVAQLFGGEISRVKPASGTVSPFVRTALPAAVEVADGDVWATTNVLPTGDAGPDGMVVRYRR